MHGIRTCRIAASTGAVLDLYLRAQNRGQVLHDEPHEPFRVERPPRPEGEAPDIRHEAPAAPSRADAADATAAGRSASGAIFVVAARSTPAAVVALVSVVVAGGCFLAATSEDSGSLFAFAFAVVAV